MMNVLFKACINGDLKQIKKLMAAGEDVNASDLLHGWTALHWATMHEHLAIVKYLIKVGAEVNKMDNSSRTPLYLASFFGRTSIVKLLLAAGADANMPDYAGKNPLYYAVYCRRIKTAKLLSKNTPGTRVYQYKDNHIALYQNAYIKIGCASYSVLYWIAKYKEIGEANGYQPEAIEAYGRFIKRCAKLEKQGVRK